MVTDNHAFGVFYEDVKNVVFQAVLASGRDRGRAEDAVASAFLKALERWESVSAMNNPTAWVIRVALNNYNSGWRVWRREVRASVPQCSAPADYPSHHVIVELVWRLSARQRAVVALRILADLSERDTATVLGITPKTVSVHLHRAIEKLRAGIAVLEKEEEAWKIEKLPAK
jgi:RNA polymerase sigma-70 factor (ECF subfamily)